MGLFHVLSLVGCLILGDGFFRKVCGRVVCLFVLRFYGPVNQWGHVERDQFT